MPDPLGEGNTEIKVPEEFSGRINPNPRKTLNRHDAKVLEGLMFRSSQ